jgi:uridine phosphorylase
MGMFNMSFEMTDEQIESFREQLLDAVGRDVNGEPVLAAGAFRRGGASATYAASKLGGGLGRVAVGLARKKKAGGLPQQVLLAVTADNLYAFKCKISRQGYQAENEVARWQRAGLRISTQEKMGLTNITIESPAEGEKVTLVPIGVKDDPVSVELISLLVGAGV